MWTTDQNFSSNRPFHGRNRTLDQNYHFEVDEWTDFWRRTSISWTDSDDGPLKISKRGRRWTSGPMDECPAVEAWFKSVHYDVNVVIDSVFYCFDGSRRYAGCRRTYAQSDWKMLLTNFKLWLKHQNLSPTSRTRWYFLSARFIVLWYITFRKYCLHNNILKYNFNMIFSETSRFGSIK